MKYLLNGVDQNEITTAIKLLFIIYNAMYNIYRKIIKTITKINYINQNKTKTKQKLNKKTKM